MFEGWSPPDPMTSDSEVICEAWASSVCPQALDIASYQLPLSVDEAPGRFIDAEPALLPTKLRTGLMVLFMVFRSEEHTTELQSLMRIAYAVFRWKQKQQNRRAPDIT